MRRLESYSILGRENRFRNEIRSRDKKCVISGDENLDANTQLGIWPGLDAAHIFPLKFENLWIQFGYNDSITDIPDDDDNPEMRKINSPKNGFLLNKVVHRMFDQYLLSVNPDDGFKVVVFGTDDDGYDGRVLDPICRDPADPKCVSTQLLRWHFRQSVLANIRGAGEKAVDDDFERDTDRLRERVGPQYTQTELRFEVAARLTEVA